MSRLETFRLVSERQSGCLEILSVLTMAREGEF